MFLKRFKGCYNQTYICVSWSILHVCTDVQCAHLNKCVERESQCPGNILGNSGFTFTYSVVLVVMPKI